MWPLKKSEKKDWAERLSDGTIRVHARNGFVTDIHPELRWLPRIKLNCGACVCLLNKYYAEELSLDCLDFDCETFRDGDTVLLCNDGCPAFNICTLAQRIIGAKSSSELESLIHPLVAKGRFLEGEVGFPGIDNAKFANPEGVTGPIRLKALVVRNNGRNRVIIPPMLADLKDGGNGSNGGDDCSES